jgi:MFS family permease
MNSEGMKRNIFLLYVMKVSHWFFLVMPIIIPFYRQNGLSMTQIMMLQAGFSLSTVVLEIPTGYFADVWGRKHTLIVGALLCFAGWTTYSFSYGFWGLLVAELIMGIGQSFISGTDSALLYDSLQSIQRKDDYSQYEGRMSSIGNFAEAIAGIIGGYLAFISLRTPFYYQALVAMIAIPASFMVTEPPVLGTPRHASLRDVFNVVRHAMLGNKQLSVKIWYSSLIGASTLTMAWMAQPCFLYIHVPMKIWGGAVNLYSILWTALNLSVGIAAIVAYRLDRLAGEKKLCLIILLFIVLGYFGAAFFHNYTALIFIFIFYCIRGIATPVLKDYINRITTSDVRATILSVRNFIIRLVFSIVGPVVGWLTDHWQLPAGMLAAGLIYGFTGLIVSLKIRSS